MRKAFLTSDFNLILAPWGWSGSIAYSWANDGATIGPGVTLDAGGIVGFSDGSIYQDVATVPGQSYQLTITAHSRGSRVTITPAPNNQGPTWIDSVSLIAVPEPSVPTFITAASAGLLAFGRRARRIS